METDMSSIVNRFRDHRRMCALVGAIGVCLVAASGSVLAATPADAAPSARVIYSDLNLTSEQGNLALYARITGAARRVCLADRIDSRDLARYAEARACEQRAIGQAVHEVHSPQLAAIYEARQPRG
jgi:UrcA family protein